MSERCVGLQLCQGLWKGSSWWNHLHQTGGGERQEGRRGPPELDDHVLGLVRVVTGRVGLEDCVNLGGLLGRYVEGAAAPCGWETTRKSSRGEGVVRGGQDGIGRGVRSL